MCEILVDDPDPREAPVARLRAASITPSAARLTESLRDVGYDFPAAVADLVDNSVMAGATRIDVAIEFDGADSSVTIADNGRGMTPNGLVEALRYGSRRRYSRGDLGRYGLGLKTASLSQCRSVSVVTRSSLPSSRTAARMLDLDLIAEWDEWLVVDPVRDHVVSRARELLQEGPGTIVIWRKLDRVLPDKSPHGGWAKRRLDSHAAKTAEHLGIVFHRFLEGTASQNLVISVNGEKVQPWNPFAPAESALIALPPHRFEVTSSGLAGKATLRRYVLPSRDQFSSPAEFERLSGPLNWNRQQGIYIYRAYRLVQWGGWNGIRGIDEHTKLARAALDFDTDLDSVFNINVAKMRVTIPPQLRQMLERPINELCSRADDTYRKTSRHDMPPREADLSVRQLDVTGPNPPSRQLADSAGLALRAAAMHSGQYEAFTRIVASLRQQAPEVAAALGLTS
jgi:hypothetical protein